MDSCKAVNLCKSNIVVVIKIALMILMHLNDLLGVRVYFASNEL